MEETGRFRTEMLERSAQFLFKIFMDLSDIIFMKNIRDFNESRVRFVVVMDKIDDSNLPSWTLESMATEMGQKSGILLDDVVKVRNQVLKDLINTTRQIERIRKPF